MKKKRSEIEAENLGDDALRALKENHHWEYRPDSVEYEMEWPSEDDGWRIYWFVSGWEVRGPYDREGPKEWGPGQFKLYHQVWSVDSDGNWDFNDEMDVDDPNYERWAADYSYEQNQRQWCEYYEDVVRTGEDPLGNFHASRPGKVEKLWEFVIKDPGPVLVHARPVGSRRWLSPDQLPENVLAYLSVQKKEAGPKLWSPLEWLLSPEDFGSVENAVRKGLVKEWKDVSPGRAHGVIAVEEELPADKNDVIRAAKKALAECRKKKH